MARNRIKGITVEIGGDVTKLDKALGSTNKQISETQAKLKDVNRLLKLDPKNVQLLDQKQRLLAQSVAFTSNKFETLKNAAESATVSNPKYEQWQKAFASLQGQITKTTKELSALEKQQASMANIGFAPDSKPMQDMEKQAEELREKLATLQQTVKDTYNEMGRPISIEQWDNLQRELAEAAMEAKDAQKAFDSFSPSLSKFSSTAQEVSDKAAKVADATKGISLAAGGLLTGMLGSVKGTEEFRSDLAKLETNAQLASIGLESTEAALKRLNAVSGETDSSVEALSNLLQSGITESNLQRAVENLAGAAISFPDTVKIESLADSLQETLATGSATGQFAEVLDRLGVGAENFTQQLSQVPGEANKLNFALDTLANQGMADVYNTWAENHEALVENKNANYEFQKSLSELAEKMQPLMTMVTELASSFMDWFNALGPGSQKAIVGILAVIAAISPMASAISSVASAVGEVSRNWGAVKTAISTVTGALFANPMLTLILGIAAAVALIALNWDTVKKTVKNVIDAIVGYIEKGINAVKKFFGILDRGKSETGGGGFGGGGGSPSPQGLAIPFQADIPGFANGGVFAPNSPILGILGDNPREREFAAPESAMTESMINALRQSGMANGQNITLNIRFAGSLGQLIRLMAPEFSVEQARKGTSLIG